MLSFFKRKTALDASYVPIIDMKKLIFIHIALIGFIIFVHYYILSLGDF